MSSPLTYQLEHPEKLSRGLLLLRLFFGYFYVLIPHGICLWFYGIGVAFVQFIAFFCVLFTGKYPEGMHQFVVGYFRWYNRVMVYMAYLTDEYPPFSGKE
jgi:hypothetical protein